MWFQEMMSRERERKRESERDDLFLSIVPRLTGCSVLYSCQIVGFIGWPGKRLVILSNRANLRTRFLFLERHPLSGS